jgi:D-3-phosphoglycerate dehydrogenase
VPRDNVDRNRAIEEEAAQALAGFDVICLLRERMPVPAGLFARPPKLKLIAVTGAQNRTLDLAAATRAASR